VRAFSRTLLAGSLLALLGAALASAQNIDFTLFVTANGQTDRIPNDSQIGLSANSNTATVKATYVGSSQATVGDSQSPGDWLEGSTQFTITVPNSETFPLVLTAGQSFSFTITYTASATNAAAGAQGQINIPYSEPGATGPVTSAIILTLLGEAPAITLSYALAPNNNEVPLASGGTIPFPPTQLNTTATGVLQISDTGSGPAQITGITGPPSTSPFQLTGKPLATPSVPYTLTPGTATATLTLGLQYTPTKVETDTAQITITFQDGTVDTVNLTGSGATSTYTYTVLPPGSTATPIKPGATITFTPEPVPTSTTSTPSTSSVLIQVTNTGNASGVINSINAGPTPPFSVSGAPATPPTLKPGDSESFEVTYTPTQVGPQAGTLLVGNDTFVLSGTGLGPQLSFGYASGGATVSIGTTGQVVFPAIAVTKSEQVNFTVTNSGTTSSTVSLVSTSAPFSVPALSSITLAPGNSTTFPITFTPTAVGPVSGILQVNGNQVQLVGAGTAPPNLPSYTFTGPSGNVSPATQQAVSLTLAQSYPVDLTGVLTLTTSGNLGTDQNVQFSTGQRTVNFLIPAGSTSADFAGQGSQILLQTGTVAETITLTPSFTTTAGVDLTPSSPPTLQFTIPALAPVIESAQVTNVTTTGFVFVITGYSTTRSLNSLNVTFMPATGFNLSVVQPAADLSGVSSVWFQSASSQAFGGQFQVTMSYNLSGSVPKNDTLIEAIASVSATVSNSVGTSNSVSGNVP
jgi:hypothetical protein